MLCLILYNNSIQSKLHKKSILLINLSVVRGIVIIGLIIRKSEVIKDDKIGGKWIASLEINERCFRGSDCI